ncbi:ABC transporter ATP-binding protein [Microlunatus soli]|uniref:ABC-2 type transport system ATP-binding protein n=1 Tax=Microlunatus soli TaxID=630515 RepID=A0A1H1WLV7_9ACTN|nr:ABC transporter ATP-binding protein [Microlunatus soli]SDS97670.1 ABC-2 type transport system ATP-binding protein [Microlunatus soli]
MALDQELDPAVAPGHPSPATTPTATPAIHLTGLTKSYGAVRAVDGIDLRIDVGELVAVLGPNGAGKSTMNELITGLVQPDSGRVAVFGRTPRQAVEAGLVGAMLQAGALLHEATVGELLRLMHGLHSHPLPVGTVIETAGLGDFLRTRTDKLSGGQAQRLRFGLAIMADPQLLILDEPTVGMDVEVRHEFWNSMRRFAEGGRTVLFATHYLEEADQIADRIVVINSGTVVADGTGAQIKSGVLGRTISMAADGVDAELLSRLPAVSDVEQRAGRILIRSRDSDATLRGLVGDFPAAYDIEVNAVGLEEAFLELTTRR